MPRMFKYTLLSRFGLCGNAFLGAFLALLALWYGATSVADYIVWSAILFFLLVLFIRSARLDIEVETDRVIVKNVFWTFKIDYHRVDRVSWVLKRGGYQLTIRRADGRWIRPTATFFKGPRDAGLDAAYWIRRRMAEFENAPLPPPPEEMVRWALLPPPPADHWGRGK